jgi:hypothetical protein
VDVPFDPPPLFQAGLGHCCSPPRLFLGGEFFWRRVLYGHEVDVVHPNIE